MINYWLVFPSHVVKQNKRQVLYSLRIGTQDMKYLFTNILGSFILDEKLQLQERYLLDDSNKNEIAIKINTQHPKIQALPRDKIPQVLALFKKKEFFPLFYKNNLGITKQKIKSSVTPDQLIIQTIANISELDKVCNLLSKRAREWYSLYLPELSQNIAAHEKYMELLATQSRKQLMAEFCYTDTMGADLSPEHLTEIVLLAKEIKQLYALRQQHEIYLQTIMKPYCPNLLELAGVTIAAHLIELGKSLKHLALLPASTIQLLGAEKALFRHIKTGARSPKYGVIHAHPLIQNAKKLEKGKAARILADKLSLCARLDYFKGEFKAPEYKKELEEKITK